MATEPTPTSTEAGKSMVVTLLVSSEVALLFAKGAADRATAQLSAQREDGKRLQKAHETIARNAEKAAAQALVKAEFRIEKVI